MTTNRGPKYSQQEVEVLAENVREHKAILLGAFTPTITAEVKEAKWRMITDKINSVSNTTRTVKQIKKKWSDLASRTKVKAAKINKGNSSGMNEVEAKESGLTQLEQTVRDVLGKTAVEGIEDGLDTLEPIGPIDIDEAASPTIQEEQAQGDSEIDDDSSSVPTITTKANHQARSDLDRKPVHRKKRKSSHDEASVTDHTEELIEIEKEKLSIMREQLRIDQERLFAEQKIGYHLEKISNLMANTTYNTTYNTDGFANNSHNLPSMDQSFVSSLINL